MTVSRPEMVVANASPLIGLARTGRLQLLSHLFSSVMIPAAVAAELRLSDSRPGTRPLALAVEAGWLAVIPVVDVPPHLAGYLGSGEAEAIALAKERRAPLLIDERIGRVAAAREGATIFGTGAVLIVGKCRGLLPAVRPEIEALQQVGYRMSYAIRAEILRLAGE